MSRRQRKAHQKSPHHFHWVSMSLKMWSCKHKEEKYWGHHKLFQDFGKLEWAQLHKKFSLNSDTWSQAQQISTIQYSLLTLARFHSQYDKVNKISIQAFYKLLSIITICQSNIQFIYYLLNFIRQMLELRFLPN